jgi:hypothetical protein
MGLCEERGEYEPLSMAQRVLPSNRGLLENLITDPYVDFLFRCYSDPELRRRLKGIAERLRVKRPDELAGQLSLLINGAFVSSQVLSPGEAGPLLRVTARALIAAARKQ